LQACTPIFRCGGCNGLNVGLRCGGTGWKKERLDGFSKSILNGRDMDGRPAFPNRKISETFLHFAAPLLNELPGEAPEHEVRVALNLSFTIWNAVIFADVLNNHRHLNEIRRLTADRPETVLLMDQLIARKRALFAGDERMIGTWEVTRTEDGINLRADARDPYSLPRDPI
jgi:hypothetical protein